MQVLRIIFMILICIPVAYLAYFLFSKIVDTAAGAPPKEDKPARRRRRPESDAQDDDWAELSSWKDRSRNE